MFLAVGAVAVLLAAAVLASPAVLRAAGLPDVAQACRRLLGRLVPAWQVLGWPVAALSTASVTMGARAWWRVRGVYRSMRVEPWLGRHQDYDGFDLVVLPTVAPLALSVAGPHGQILISEGLVASLGPDYLEAVLAHEAAHLRYGHQRYLAVAAVVDGAFGLCPLVRRSTAVLRLALERWADEEAAGAVGGGRVAVRRALLQMTVSSLDPELAAFSATESIEERLAALETEPPRSALSMRHLGVVLPAGGMVLGAAAGLLGWGMQAGHMLAMAGTCSI